MKPKTPTFFAYFSLRRILLGILALLIGFFYIFPYVSSFLFPYNNSHMDTKNTARAYFAGGCFWCMEGIFESQTGVTQAISGYAGGTEETATYDQVSAGHTDHREVVEIQYDPKLISYETLTRLYFTQIDPTQVNGQFADKGYSYSTAILYQNDREKKIAEDIKKEIGDSGKFDKPIAVKIEPFTTFFPAEEYHQDYYKKSAFRYNLYKEGSGRKGFIEEKWQGEINRLRHSDEGRIQVSGNEFTGSFVPQDDSTDNLKSKLTDIQYAVTQEDATERPFANPYWDNHELGIYVDIVDGSPLFASLDKFDSGTGWPSFTRTMTGASVIEKTDYKLVSSRTEVRSKNANSHLGHLFDDGPVEKGGMRYCINSAALRFIPLSDMEKEGYGEYVKYFQ